MVGWAHIILVGASIVSNAHKDGWITYSLNELEEKLKQSVSRNDLVEALLRYVEGDFRRASAELNTCVDLIVEGYGHGKQQWVYLLSSDTEVGKLCSEVLARFLKKYSSEKLNNMLAVINPMLIPSLGDPRKFNDGLANLFQKIIDIISYHKKKGDYVFVHATGGFKPETAIAILAANMPTTGAPTFYIHEHFNQLVRIPAMPLAFRKWKKFSGMIDHLINLGKVSKEQCVRLYGRRAVVEGIRLGWIEEEDNFLKPTAFGRLIWRKLKK